MSEAGVFLLNILLFLIDLATLGLIGGIFYVIGLAVITMARNQKPNWESILYVVLILLSAIWLIRWYPRQVIISIRVSLEESRPEADALREELKLWLPGTDSLIVATPSPGIPLAIETPTDTPVILPSPSPMVAAPVTYTVSVAPAATTTPYPTYTPYPTLTPLPTATPCLVQLLDSGDWVMCPPTPVPGGE